MCEFLHTFVEQKQEDDRWEYFIHKVWDKSYSDFCEALRISQDLQGMSKDDIEATIQESIKILGNFKPEKEEGEV